MHSTSLAFAFEAKTYDSSRRGRLPPTRASFRRPWWVEIRASIDRFELYAAILGAAFGRRVVRNGIRLAEPLSVDAAGVDSVRHQVIAHGLRAPLRERLVVLVGAARVGVGAESHPPIGTFLQLRDRLVQRRGRLRL